MGIRFNILYKFGTRNASDFGVGLFGYLHEPFWLSTPNPVVQKLKLLRIRNLMITDIVGWERTSQNAV